MAVHKSQCLDQISCGYPLACEEHHLRTWETMQNPRSRAAQRGASCRRGACARCKVKVTGGKLTLADYTRKYVADACRARGRRRGECRTRHTHTPHRAVPPRMRAANEPLPPRPRSCSCSVGRLVGRRSRGRRRRADKNSACGVWRVVARPEGGDQVIRK